MPNRNLGTCTTPGCSTRVTSGRCPTCRARTQRAQDRARPTPAQRGYRQGWAAGYLAEHPTCAACGQLATIPDHVIPRAQLVDMGVPDPDAWHRLQPLCARCHGRKTVAVDGGFGRSTR